MMSNLSQWVEFDVNYLREQVEAQKASGLPPHRWGCGTIHNSTTGFWKVAGATVRTPDMYYRTNYKTGMRIGGEMLVNTNEMVHASVRARLHYGGPGTDGVARYAPNALKEWACGAGDKWAYTGRDKAGLGKVMAEDKMGDFEMQLLTLVDPQAAAELFEE